MDWIPLIFFIAGLATVVFLYRSSQKTVVVAEQHQVPAPEDGISAIEYFWRPG